DVVLAQRPQHRAHVLVGTIADLTETIGDFAASADFDSGEFGEHQVALPHLRDEIGQPFVEHTVLRYPLEPHALLLPGARTSRTLDRERLSAEGRSKRLNLEPGASAIQRPVARRPPPTILAHAHESTAEAALPPLKISQSRTE